jgi:metallo-beta-lactamase family protein
MPTLTFHGAARTVTGSKHLLEVDGRRILIDCGQFQGRKDLRLLNWTRFPFDPATLDAVVLTHAHLDHSGLLPRLAANGFKGRIYCTPGTLELCGLVLPDAGRIQEEDARQANKYKFSKHEPAQPLFTENDALRALTQLQPIGYEKRFDLGKGISFEFLNAGHLLGSAMVSLRIDGAGGERRLTFTGDLGRPGLPILRDPSPVPAADLLISESTYGGHTHEPGVPFRAVGKGDFRRSGLFNHMEIGDHVPGSVPDESRAGSLGDTQHVQVRRVALH